MRILRYVSFDGPFGKPDAGTFEEGGIPDAARAVAAGLGSAGIPHSTPSNRGDWAYDFAAGPEGTRVELIVASTDDDRPFVASIECSAGLFAGRARKEALASTHGAVCIAIHRELSANPVISKLRWWTEEQWEAEKDWTEAP